MNNYKTRIQIFGTTTVNEPMVVDARGASQVIFSIDSVGEGDTATIQNQSGSDSFQLKCPLTGFNTFRSYPEGGPLPVGVVLDDVWLFTLLGYASGAKIVAHVIYYIPS